MIKTLLILGLISGFGLMFLGVIALFSNYAELLLPYVCTINNNWFGCTDIF